MYNPDNFQIVTDFATTKETNSHQIIVKLPAGTYIPVNGTATAFQEWRVGGNGWLVRSRIASRRNGTQFQVCSTLRYFREDVTLPVYATVTRSSAETIRCSVFVVNDWRQNYRTNADEEFVFEVSVVVPPVA